MAYAYQTFAQTKTQLAARLSDPAKVHFVDTELGVYITESLRTFGLLSAFWRERGAVTLASGTAFYDLSTELPALLGCTVTDHEIIQQIQYHLLEPTTSQMSWLGTSQFTYADITGAIQRRLNQFLADTGIFLSRVSQSVALVGRQTLDDRVIDVRRMTFQRAALGYYSQVWREDEFAMSAGNPSWNTDSGLPTTYSIMGPPPLQVELVPSPDIPGTMDMIVVRTGTPLDPAITNTALGIPNDLTPAIKWGALADVLGKDGPAADPIRAAWCEQRYQMYVQLAKVLPCVVQPYVQGQAQTVPSALEDLDTSNPGWQNTTGTPRYTALAGWNMLAVYPVPRGTSSLMVDVVRNSVVPTADGDFIQVGREQMDAILDYAEHLAFFKEAGAEFDSTQRQAENFLLQAMTYNKRLTASARYIVTPKQFSYDENYKRPRTKDGDALGTLPSGTASGPNKQRVPVRLK